MHHPCLRALKGHVLSDEYPEAAHPASEAVRGGAAVAMSGIGRKVLSLLVAVLLARLLTPAEFGAFAIISALVALGQVLHDGGLSSAAVQREHLSTQAISTMFWINSAVGLTLTVLFAGAAQPIASFFRHPELVPLCQVTSLSFVLNGLVVQHRALLQR